MGPCPPGNLLLRMIDCSFWRVGVDKQCVPCCSYEKQGRVRRVVKAQQLWYAIIESQTETGTPYMLYKDSCNRKSNQQNLGTIKCSNLCTEIVEYTSKDEVSGDKELAAFRKGVTVHAQLFRMCLTFSWGREQVAKKIEDFLT